MIAAGRRRLGGRSRGDGWELSATLALLPGPARAAFDHRVATVSATLDGPTRGRPRSGLTGLAATLRTGGPAEAWLTLAVVTGRLPTGDDVLRLVRAARLGRPLGALLDALHASGQIDARDWPPVEVLRDTVVVDIHHTARNLFATGIQRVAREASSRWYRDHGATMVGWTPGYQAFRRLTPEEREAAFLGRSGSDRPGADGPTGPAPSEPTADPTLIVPWRCTHLVPELPAELERSGPYQAFARYSGGTTGLIGFDLVPVMAADTAAEGMPLAFSLYLTAAAHFTRIATISRAAACEYRGWRTMLAGVGGRGPDIHPIPLPTVAREPSDAAVREVGEQLGVGPFPIVLAVGSHEPRKNHLAVLHAAEVLWREGRLFSLAFVGGNSWSSDEFSAQIGRLRDSGRPVQSIVALPDELLWAAYRVAHCTVFPSLHEGFGLPAAESLASGTPVITSDFGSMQEVAEAGGALLVDPRDDRQLVAALRRLLTDPDLRDRLAAEARARPPRTWDDYAAEVWSYLVDGVAPAEP